MPDFLLQSLPPETLDIVLSSLGLISLVQLHCATAASFKTVSRRISAMKCACHWLNQSKRLPLAARNRRLDATRKARHRQDERQTNQEVCWQIQQQADWPSCSKHTILGILQNQIQHVNDIATLLHHCTASVIFSWGCELNALGFKIPERQKSHMEVSMQRLLDNIKQAFLIGYDKFLDFQISQKDNVNNVWKEFIALDNDNVQYHPFTDKLAFMCTLYRLQQLPPQAVLARFHRILSRCSRFELLLLSQILGMRGRNVMSRDQYMASRREVPAADVLTAFAQIEPNVRGVMLSLTEAQRRSMMLCVKEMVDRFVAGNTISVSRYHWDAS